MKKSLHINKDRLMNLIQTIQYMKINLFDPSPSSTRHFAGLQPAGSDGVRLDQENEKSLSLQTIMKKTTTVKKLCF